MRIAVGSAFRNSAGPQLGRYARQLDALKRLSEKLGHTLEWIATEGDSVDNTRMEIQQYARHLPIETTITVRDHGGPVFGSTEAVDRMKALSFVGNGILESVSKNVDVLIYVESDLRWKPDTMLRLIDKLQPGVDVVSPLIFAGDLFYDIWGFRKNGERFSPFEPYHPQLSKAGLTQVDSAGSCLVMRGEVARNCRMRNGGALVDFCEDVWSHGFTIFADARERVEHPA